METRNKTKLKKMYWKIFTGQNLDTIKNKYSMNKKVIERIRDSDFSSLMMDLKEMITFFKTKVEHNFVENWSLLNVGSKKYNLPSEKNPLISKTNSSNWPLYVSYITPLMKCFTRKVEFEKNMIKVEDSMQIHKDVLDNITKKDNALTLKMYLHHPLHQVRSFGTEVTNHLLNPNYQYTIGYPDLKITVSDVKVLRRRHDSNTPCNPDADNQDYFFQKAAINEIGCIPPYWKSFMNGSNYGTSFCRNSTQLETAFNYFEKVFRNDRQISLKNEDAPCGEMSVISNVESLTKNKDNAKLSKKTIKITFRYPGKQYRETVNSQAYLFQSLLSSVGGYIGMFLGFGLLQILEVISTLYGHVTQKIKHITGRE